MNRELLKQALDQLKRTRWASNCEAGYSSDPVIATLEAELDKPEQEPIKFLANGVRYKVTHQGYYGCSIVGLPENLNGQWVALVEATDSKHLNSIPPKELSKPEQGEVVVTKNPDGQIVAVTRQDEDGRILKVIDTSAKLDSTQEQIYEIIIRWDSSGKRSRRELARRVEALFTEPRAHITDGTPCWCDPIKELAKPEQAALESTVRAHIKDLQECVKALEDYPKFAATRLEICKAIEELGSALSEPEQEPVANEKEGSPCPEFWDWLPKAYNFVGDGVFTKYNMEVAFLAGKQFSSTAPRELAKPEQKPRKEWVGLTDDEILAFVAFEPHPLMNRTSIICAVEAKLKKKNT